MENWLEKVGEIMTNVSDIVTKTSGLADQLASLAQQIGRQTEGICLMMTEIQKQEGKAIQNFRAISYELQSLIEKARQYTEKVRDLSRYEPRMEKVHRGLQCQPTNYKPLDDYIDDLLRFIAVANRLHPEFSRCCDVQISAAGNAEEMCRNMAREARTRKTTTQFVGWTATTVAYAAGISTGVAASVAAGTLTLGIGTLVGLFITATTATAAGVGMGTVGALATHRMTNDFDKLEKALEELKKSFCLLQEIGYKMHNNLGKLQLQVESIGTDIDDVQHSRDHHETPEYAIERLHERLAQVDLASCNQALDEMSGKLTMQN